jgi:GNAT superfamily N-acetyltransferase
MARISSFFMAATYLRSARRDTATSNSAPLTTSSPHRLRNWSLRLGCGPELSAAIPTFGHMIERDCVECGATVQGEDLTAFGLAGLAHVRAAHPQMPYPDMAVRNVFEGLVHSTGPVDRLEAIGTVEVHAVADGRIDDWLALFDDNAFPDNPVNSGCYCLEPHELAPGQPLPEMRHWTERRQQMVQLIGSGVAAGYLAYVDGKAAGWVNASMRSGYTLFRRGDTQDPTTIGIACFAIAPPYRKHGIARELLTKVIADAPSRGAQAVEAYPLNANVPTGGGFRGSRAMYEALRFEAVKVRTFDTVMRRNV